MIVAAHQPNYMPWIGYFYKLSVADVMVVLDQVQYSKEGFQNRNRVKTATGVQWLTLPVLTKGRFGQATYDVELNDRVPWRRQHLNTLEANYARAPYFRAYFGELQELYQRPWERLVDLNQALIQWLAGHLGIQTRFVLASDLGVVGKSTDMLIDACQKVGGGIYLSGFGGADYQSEAQFRRAGIECRIYDFRHPVYPQLWGTFEPNLSVLDLLFNCGRDAQAIIRSCGGGVLT